jgi:hypothetical protein
MTTPDNYDAPKHPLGEPRIIDGDIGVIEIAGSFDPNDHVQQASEEPS